ncbi:RagB/SusD family nutrient uptake outer membrane protein [Myroides sp. 1354]|uniref:RagB/SusD family nutrient uptake outer membrane protein n=1 Tax=unclassified Myroides TaxID=2642485 RepID=UPI00257678C5|nr:MULTISPECIES: RagB/SusD family nutrient uptake outer membrane protein [unclassified Myroides]MDM1044353.1 RagB/SusD family nutrient uptake outer membrane protein [Myroides sp. R163-1]MDM1056227.1 RagB/SusD family nutrient uptake outer membrane protein [Myroides sp. 1354]MDM1069417.1 RagB/SusD family nutrient uptake outer membrane protein [Myroides sp. 1372]
MKNWIYTSLFLISILTLQSCEKMIDIDLPTDQINTEGVFKDRRSATSALTNLYINLRESSTYSGNSQGIGTQLGLYADELEPISIAPTEDSALLFNNMIDPTRGIIEKFWNTSYSHIYTINSFINGVTKSTGITDKDKASFIAESYVLRAMYYQTLTQLFGDIPYTISTDYKVNTTIKKTSHLEILAKIEHDLLIALESLSYNDRSSNKYYVNKAVAELILAKNYLLQKNYDKTEMYIKLVIDNPLYSLETDLSQVFKNTAKSTLWQLSNNNPTAATYEASNYTMLVSDWPYRLNPVLLNSFQDNDLRKTNWTNEFSSTNSSYNYKYKNALDNTDECSILFRIEEAYFILSEALIYQNKEKEAIYYINKIRLRSGLDPLPDTLSREETLLALLEESRKEFFLEHARRFFDLKRNDKLSFLKESKPNWQDKHALLPYPEKELLINPNLNPQNEY